jgi:hypothetical protein
MEWMMDLGIEKRSEEWDVSVCGMYVSRLQERGKAKVDSNPT